MVSLLSTRMETKDVWCFFLSFLFTFLDWTVIIRSRWQPTVVEWPVFRTAEWPFLLFFYDGQFYGRITLSWWFLRNLIGDNDFRDVFSHSLHGIFVQFLGWRRYFLLGWKRMMMLGVFFRFILHSWTRYYFVIFQPWISPATCEGRKNTNTHTHTHRENKRKKYGKRCRALTRAATSGGAFKRGPRCA